MKYSLFLILALSLFQVSLCRSQSEKSKSTKNKSNYEQLDWPEMINLYMNKDKTSVGTIEGIYIISGLVTRTGKGLFSSEEKEKILDRKENYARVFIIRDPVRNSREYAELVLEGESSPSLSVIGEFSAMSKENVMSYKHYDEKGKEFDTYTFTYDKETDSMEGIRTETKGNATITFKLTYLKTLPKAGKY